MKYPPRLSIDYSLEIHEAQQKLLNLQVLGLAHNVGVHPPLATSRTHPSISIRLVCMSVVRWRILPNYSVTWRQTKQLAGTLMNSTTSLLTRITQTPGQCGGRPCIRGMRIRVTDILEMLAENVSVTEILEDFPDLELADIQACLLFAARRTDFPRLTA